MPFFEADKSPKFEIDYSLCQAVSVMAVFNPIGDFKPLYFSLVDLYGNACKVQITGVKHSNEVRGGKSFCCTYLAGEQQRECILTYYVDKLVWVLGN